MSEVKKILKSWCDMQREKYGDNWKEIVAKQMTEKTAPTIEKLLKLRKQNDKP